MRMVMSTATATGTAIVIIVILLTAAAAIVVLLGADEVILDPLDHGMFREYAPLEIVHHPLFPFGYR